MKFFVLSLLIAAVSATSPTAPPTHRGGSLCPCTISAGVKNGLDPVGANSYGPPFGGVGSPCVARGDTANPCSAGALTTTCMSTTGRRCTYYQECGKVEGNSTLNNCMPKGNFMCPRFRYLSKRETADDGDSAMDTLQTMNNDGSVDGCTPSQSCCNGQCCNTNQACMAITTGAFIYDGTEYADATAVARNDWKTIDGAEMKNKPMACMAQGIWMNSTAGMKVIFLPIVGIVLIALCFMQANGKKSGEMMDNLAPMLMMVFGIFMMFSHNIGFAFVCALTAAVTMCASPAWTSWVCLFQIIIFFFCAGGRSFFVNNNVLPALGWFTADNNLFTSYLSSATGIAGPATQCGTYYNFFTYIANNKKWMTNANRTTWGYCSQEWVSFQVFNVTMQMVAFMFMIVQTAIKAVSGGGDGRTSQALSAAKV